ncbi:MAG: SpoVR family protein [Planctomycetia bacterium]|nr:SpoVR family protein [Planctomycetia bacterium]
MNLGFYNTNLPPHLRVLKDEIEGYARGFGLDFYETIFEVVDADDLNEIAAYGGFPTRYPHWSFGMQYEELKKGYEYGLSKIYEMVINNDPCYAYLMRCNHTVDQKLVMAHVYGHCLAPETEVITENGPKFITDVRVGDLVLTHTGEFKPVRVVARRHYSGPIYRVRVEGADVSVRITGEHPVAVLYEDGLKWTPAAELLAGMFVGLPHTQTALVGAGVETNSRIGLWVVPGEEDHCRIEQAGFIWQCILAPKVELYSGYVYNFSVAEDESYVLSAGMTVHNCDFFKNNAYFGHTTRKMMDEIANHAARIRRYVERFGEDEVESFMDKCMSIDDLIDIHSVAIKRRDDASKYDFSPAGTGDEPDKEAPARFKAKGYMADYINPRDTLKTEDEEKKLSTQRVAHFPEHPEKDVLLFLIEHAPLKNWQRDILSIVRDEAYYFYPQAQTKVINEGWASFWHSTIMTQKVLQPSEVIDYADHHSGTMATSSRRLNPYKVGIELLRDIERRWNMGQFGPEWDNCEDMDKKRTWDKQLGLGRQKIFEVRKIHNDITFIDTFLTPEFCKEYNLFSFNYQEQTKNYVIESREFQKIKQRLLFSLTNFGKPWIYAVDGNHRNRGELLLRHEHNGVDLKIDEARDVLANVQYIWARPVHLETITDGHPTVLSFDGNEHTQQVTGGTDDASRKAPAKTK